MASWTEHLDNPKALSGYFSSREGLDDVDLHECSLDRDGPLLRLRFDLSRFPDKPSSRWDASANRAQATLAFWFVGDVDLRGYGTTMVGTLTVEPRGQLLDVRFHSPACVLSFTCVLARLDKLVGYCCDAS